MYHFKRISALCLSAAALVAMPANAQVEKQDDDFDGPYIGGAFGLSAQPNDKGETIIFDTDIDGNYGDTVATATGANAFSPGFCNGFARGRTPGDGCFSDDDDIEYAVRLGYDKRMGDFVVGVLAEGSRSEARDSATAFSTTPASYTFTREMDYALSVRGRAGYTPGGGVLFYGTGGVSYARMDNSFTTTNGANSFTDSGKDWALGAQFGGGVEVKLLDNVTMGLEYLYNTYQDDDYVVNVGPGTAPPTNPFLIRSGQTNMTRGDGDFNFHSVRVTTSFRF